MVGNMPSYVRAGSVPPKRHTQFRGPDGGLYAEELFSRQGFSSTYALLYHLRPPTATLDVRPWQREPIIFEPNDPLRNRHFQTGSLVGVTHAAGRNALDARTPLLGNADVVIALAEFDRATESFYRNAGGDELLFIHAGAGTLESPFGDLAYRARDYLIIPSGTTYRLQPSESTRAIVYESTGQITIPRRFRNDWGQLEEHAPYYERDFRAPTFRDPIDACGEFEIHVTSRGRRATYVVENHPFDLIGWDGYCYPYAFNIDDYAPITGKLHQPPPVHATFEAPGAAFCAFVPRLVDYHPLAIAVPYNHASPDCDEVLYYVSGNFMSRRGISEGSITLHPAGAMHGPQPGAVEASLGRTATDELAIMVDTFAPLGIARAALACEDAQYFRSWAAKV
jgi:homogentisate 1,2-dioxygenase